MNDKFVFQVTTPELHHVLSTARNRIRFTFHSNGKSRLIYTESTRRQDKQVSGYIYWNSLQKGTRYLCYLTMQLIAKMYSEGGT